MWMRQGTRKLNCVGDEVRKHYSHRENDGDRLPEPSGRASGRRGGGAPQYHDADAAQRLTAAAHHTDDVDDPCPAEAVGQGAGRDAVARRRADRGGLPSA